MGVTGDPRLRVVRAATVPETAFTLTAILHDEAGALPAFLDHYRALGVGHFVLIDDRSTDGSATIARAAPDVTLLESDHRYGDQVPTAHGTDRAATLWRQALLDRYGAGAWSLHLDLDELVDLPAGMRFPDLAKRLGDGCRGRVAWGAMIDMYPADLATLDSLPDDLGDALAADWYFDAKPHLALPRRGKPVERYSGARARLWHRNGIDTKPEPALKRLRRRMTGNPYPFVNRVRKPVLLRWQPGDRIVGAHDPGPLPPVRAILPVRHYKFGPGLRAKMTHALESRAYAGGSVEYRHLQRLLERLSASDGSFLGPESRAYTGYADFLDTGNALGLDAPTLT